MNQQQILSGLCVYDNRNPNFVFDTEESDDCQCFNCSSGKTMLANHILLMQQNSFTKDSWDKADKIQVEGYIYVRYNDLKINSPNKKSDNEH